MWRKFLIEAAVLLVLVVLVAAAWWLYDLGKVHGVEELAALRTEHAMLQGLHDRLVNENETLLERLAVLDRSGRIDRQAAKDLQSELVTLQEELQATREEVEFYRGIVAPGDVKPGLRLHRFTLKRGPLPSQYQYDLMLTQLKRNDRYVAGNVDWNIVGEMDDQVRALDLADVTENGNATLKFRFRYFQRLTGVVTLPEGFQAQEVRLSIKTTGKNASGVIEQVFEWPVAES
jgi:hypothetical protein